MECGRESKLIRFLERTHKVHFIEKRNLQKGFLWSGSRLTNIQASTTPENVWPEVWTKIGNAAQNREKQEWANEKPKLEHARRMEGICFIDPEDGEYKRNLQIARREVGSSNGCGKGTKKHFEFQETEEKSCESNKIPKTKLACIVVAHESTRQRLESSLPKDHDDRTAGKGYDSIIWIR